MLSELDNIFKYIFISIMSFSLSQNKFVWFVHYVIVAAVLFYNTRFNSVDNRNKNTYMIMSSMMLMAQ